MIQQENAAIFNMESPDKHDPHCKLRFIPETGLVEGCCEPPLKTFNRYNQQVYTDQQIELPFEIGSGQNANASKSHEACDVVS